MTAWHIGGDGGWDYLTADSQTHRLFVTRSTHTMVIDAAGGTNAGSAIQGYTRWRDASVEGRESDGLVARE